MALFSVAVAGIAGCGFSERPFPPRRGDVIDWPQSATPLATRPWLRVFHERARDLLPHPNAALLTDDLAQPTGGVVDVNAHFELVHDELGSVLGNWTGIQQTAQCSGSPDAAADDLWDGFQEVWVPVERNLTLNGKLGWALAANGKRKQARCVVILPGFFGDHSVRRTRDMATALLDAGLHVLAVEIAGHGETEKKFPDVPYTFGYLEAKELLDVSQWVRTSFPEVTDTGLIGFSWGGNTALMSGYYASTLPDGNGRTPGKEYAAGVLAFSPVPDYDHFLQNTDGTHSLTNDVVLSRLENVIRLRQQQKGYADQSGNFDALARAEFSRVAYLTPEFEADARAFLQLLPAPGEQGRLAEYDRPFMIVQGANDPLRSAQDVATLVAPAGNPNVGTVILAGGGHVGFAAYARAYFYSIIVRFFDPSSAPIAIAGKPEGDANTR